MLLLTLHCKGIRPQVRASIPIVRTERTREYNPHATIAFNVGNDGAFRSSTCVENNRFRGSRTSFPLARVSDARASCTGFLRTDFLHVIFAHGFLTRVISYTGYFLHMSFLAQVTSGTGYFLHGLFLARIIPCTSKFLHHLYLTANFNLNSMRDSVSSLDYMLWRVR